MNNYGYQGGQPPQGFFPYGNTGFGPQFPPANAAQIPLQQQPAHPGSLTAFPPAQIPLYQGNGYVLRPFDDVPPDAGALLGASDQNHRANLENMARDLMSGIPLHKLAGRQQQDAATHQARLQQETFRLMNADAPTTQQSGASSSVQQQFLPNTSFFAPPAAPALAQQVFFSSPYFNQAPQGVAPAPATMVMQQQNPSHDVLSQLNELISSETKNRMTYLSTLNLDQLIKLKNHINALVDSSGGKLFPPLTDIFNLVEANIYLRQQRT